MAQNCPVHPVIQIIAVQLPSDHCTGICQLYWNTPSFLTHGFIIRGINQHLINTMLKSAQLHNTHRVQGEVRFPAPGLLGPGQRSPLVPGMRAARPRNRGSIAGGCQPSIFSKAFTKALAPIHLRSQRVQLALSPGAKRAGHEANHSCPYSAEFKNEWSCTFILKYACNVCTDNLTVTFMTRLRSIGKMTQLHKMQTPRMAVLFCERGGGPSHHRFTISIPSTHSAKDEERSGMPTLSQELTHCKRVVWRLKEVQQTNKSEHLEGGDKCQCRFEGKHSWSNTGTITVQ